MFGHKYHGSSFLHSLSVLHEVRYHTVIPQGENRQSTNWIPLTSQNCVLKHSEVIKSNLAITILKQLVTTTILKLFTL